MLIQIINFTFVLSKAIKQLDLKNVSKMETTKTPFAEGQQPQRSKGLGICWYKPIRATVIRFRLKPPNREGEAALFKK